MQILSWQCLCLRLDPWPLLPLLQTLALYWAVNLNRINWAILICMCCFDTKWNIAVDQIFLWYFLRWFILIHVWSSTKQSFEQTSLVSLNCHLSQWLLGWRCIVCSGPSGPGRCLVPGISSGDLIGREELSTAEMTLRPADTTQLRKGRQTANMSSQSIRDLSWQDMSYRETLYIFWA